jgi:uncharacterized protein with GYD domain
MAKYLTFFSYTGEAAARLVGYPEDRAKAARAVIEGAGGRLETFYWMFGDYDGFVIYEVPDARTAGAVAIAVATSGLLKTIKTQQLLDSADALAALRQARAVASTYEPPGGREAWREGYDRLG